MEEYEKALYQQGRVKETQKYRKAVEAEDWQEIIKEKQKLEKMIKEYRKKQDILIKEQNPEILEKMKKEYEAKNAKRVVIAKV